MGQIVAMKFIPKKGKNDKELRNLRQEINILRKLNHENIVLMLDSFETKTDFCVVMEYAQVSESIRSLEIDVGNENSLALGGYPIRVNCMRFL